MSNTNKTRAIVWMRRALRVEDNLALFTAQQNADEIIPVLFLRSDARYRDDTPRRRFVRANIAALDAELRRRGSRLFLIVGEAETQLPRFARQVNAAAVFAVAPHDPITNERDAKIASALQSIGIAFHTVKDRVLLEPSNLMTQAGEPFIVFTPFKRAWLRRSMDIQPPLPELSRVNTPTDLSETTEVSNLRALFSETAIETGERAARRRLQQFLQCKVDQYDRTRNIPAVDGTSCLSPFLSLGVISIRQVFTALNERRAQSPPGQRTGIDAFLNELIWREFAYYIITHYPHVTQQSFRQEFEHLPWRDSDTQFSAWCRGETGFPLVDAGMRQLAQEGWMHNRVRMVVASFLTKDLLIHWQRGESFFMEHLTDLDIASNNSGWQWAASTGVDPRPLRIFNPRLQAERFDPEGNYIKQYVPELRNVPRRYIHAPHEMPPTVQEQVGCRIGKDYPAPIVDHTEAASHFKTWYGEVKRQKA